MHWEWFYNKNALEMVSLKKFIGNGFTIKIHWKLFYKNVLENIYYKNSPEINIHKHLFIYRRQTNKLFGFINKDI